MHVGLQPPCSGKAAAPRRLPHASVEPVHVIPRFRTCSTASPTSTMAATPTFLSTLKSAKYAAELADACKAVKLASRLCQGVQHQLGEAEKSDKSDDSPVTVADYAAQAVVAWTLSRSLTPGTRLSMIAEEDSSSLRAPDGQAMLTRITELINNSVRLVEPQLSLSPEDVIDLIDMGSSQGGPVGRHWVLDPIDGTRGFVSMRQYSVCLGLVEEGEVVLGVLGCPNLPQGSITDEDGGEGAMERAASADTSGCLFLAHRGHGAYAAPLWSPVEQELGQIERIYVQDVPEHEAEAPTARFMESFESRHSDRSLTARVATASGVTLPPLRMDSQVKYGLLSRGAASVFMRFPPPTYKEKIWDHCAGFVIVEEAGGRVTDGAGTRLDFSKGRYLQLDRGIIAAPPRLHARLINAVAQLTTAQ